MFQRISFDENTRQQVEGEIVYPSGGDGHGIGEEFHYAGEAAELADIGKTERIEYQPGIDDRQQGDDDTQNKFVAMHPEWQEDQNDPAAHCNIAAKGEDSIRTHEREFARMNADRREQSRWL